MTQLRADRVATLFLFQPFSRMRRAGKILRVPILMYHSISRSEEKGIHPYYQTVTSPEIFADHIRGLHDCGYRTSSLGEIATQMRTADGNLEKTVVITFDDGYQDFHRAAFPVLSQYGYSATVFLPTAYIGEDGRKFNGRDCLNWSEVRELAKAGVEFGSHTVTHPQLWNVSRETIRREIGESKAAIEQNLGKAVKSFSYPYALPEPDRSFTRFVRETLVETGYENGVSTVIGLASAKDDLFFMKRLPANSGDDQRLLCAKLEGAYDWLHAAQYAWKAVSGAWAGGSRRQSGSAQCTRAGIPT